MARNKKSPAPKGKKSPGKTASPPAPAALSLKEQAAIDRKKPRLAKPLCPTLGPWLAFPWLPR
ncbi:MAG: hypothetical protein HC860_18935 [Alkalinema sp. RU_4_3]|nr:hypothetical protein [Alkalinema sp. RU_4_3]